MQMGDLSSIITGLEDGAGMAFAEEAIVDLGRCYGHWRSQGWFY